MCKDHVLVCNDHVLACNDHVVICADHVTCFAELEQQPCAGAHSKSIYVSEEKSLLLKVRYIGERVRPAIPHNQRR